MQRFKIFSKVYFAFYLLGLIFFIGMLGYITIEDYGFIDAFYMTVITVSTVGFNEVQPLSEEGRLFTSFLILFSISIYAYSISVITSYIIEGKLKNYYIDKKVNKQLKNISDHVIICGYGRNGRQAAHSLQMHKKKYVVIENKPELVSKLREEGKCILIEGDATDDELMERAMVSRAQALITTLPKDADNLFVVLSARQLNSNMTIISRASEDSSDKKLRKAGADNVIMPDKVGGSHMASLVLTPDVVEFLDHISVEGMADINLEEITFSEIPSDYKFKTLRDLEARFRTGCTVIGFKTSKGEYMINPGADTEISPNSKLFVLGRPDQIAKLNSILNIKRHES